jgi:hypothetical protein
MAQLITYYQNNGWQKDVFPTHTYKKITDFKGYRLIMVYDPNKRTFKLTIRHPRNEKGSSLVQGITIFNKEVIRYTDWKIAFIYITQTLLNNTIK